MSIFYLQNSVRSADYASDAEYTQTFDEESPMNTGISTSDESKTIITLQNTKGVGMAEDHNTRIGRMIRDRRKALGLSLQDMQDKTGINNGNLSKIERGQQSLTNDTMVKISSALNVELAELFSTTTHFVTDSATISASRTEGRIRLVSEYEKLTSITEETVAIGTIEVTHSPRGGVKVDVNEKNAIAFYAGAIRELKAVPQDLAATTVDDNLMEPRFFKGDTVVVDRGDAEIPASGGVFAVVIDGRTAVLRRLLPHFADGIAVRVDNKNYPDHSFELVGADCQRITIVGRVKHLSACSGF